MEAMKDKAEKNLNAIESSLVTMEDIAIFEGAKAATPTSSTTLK
jgi:hypothetical protein